jgi:hypothetical protein
MCLIIIAGYQMELDKEECDKLWEEGLLLHKVR